MPAQSETANQAQVTIDPVSARLLDNPIWSALTTDHAHLAIGGSNARRYPADIGPLSGMPAQSAAGYEALHPLAGPGGVVALFFLEPPRPTAGWTLLRTGTLHQMVAAPQRSTTRLAAPDGAELRQLSASDAAAMVKLAELTEPGPFRQRTIELGSYFGILQSGRLLAMAGKRMHLPGFVEVSAVCTHPDARGRGYARLLMSCVMDEIVHAGKTPFLHTLAENHTAIRLYESLGFVFRQSFELAVIGYDSVPEVEQPLQR